MQQTNGIFVAGSHNVIERCILQAKQRYRSSDQQTFFFCKPIRKTGRHAITLSTVHHLITATPATGENADGFAAKLTCGEGNVFDGCISYCNCDDGWDLYAKPATGSTGVVTIKNCVAFGNGKLTNGEGSANGDMNGFKLGGSNKQCPTPHVVTNCLCI